MKKRASIAKETSPTDVMSKLGQMWSATSVADKKPYEDLPRKIRSGMRERWPSTNVNKIELIHNINLSEYLYTIDESIKKFQISRLQRSVYLSYFIYLSIYLGGQM